MMLSDVCLSDVCLTSVCRVHRAKVENREARKTQIGTEVAHVTHDSDTTFKFKRSKVKVTRPLWLAVQVTT